MTRTILPIVLIVATTILCMTVLLPMALASLAQTLPVLARIAGS